MNFNQTWFLKFVTIVLPMSITCLAIVRHSSKFYFIPNHYDIQIRPILDPGEDAGSQNTAPGIVKVIGVIRNKTNLLRFYSYGLQVDPNSIKINCLSSINGIEGSLNVSNVSKVNNDKELVIQLRNETAGGDELEVYMEYLITIGNWGGNLVYSKCQSEECRNSIIVGTRFQMEHKYVSYTWIWRAFPSVEDINVPKSEDSGSFKATFSLTIIRKDAQKSVSNTEIIWSTPDPNHEGWVLDKYSETEKISPDMLSFVVFSNYSTLTIESTNVTIRVHAASSYLQNGRALFAAEIGTTLMNFLEEYLNASIFTNGKMKLDFVIAPSVWIPLVSWQICYFSPNSPTGTILVDEKNTTRSRIIVANNIVTCVVENWAYQAGENCLSAGIKLYLKQLAMEHLSTLTNTPTDTVTYFEEFRQAFYITNVDSLRPYKSWAITRMFKGFLNRLSSQTLLQSYFHLANENDEGITDEILIDRMKEVLPLIGDALPSWCGNVGYPLIKIGKLNESRIILSQEPFKIDNNNNGSMKNITWNIPISVNINGYEKYWRNFYWLNSKMHLVAQNMTSSVILLNPRGTGYYRVLYDEELYHLIQKQLMENANFFHQEGRAQLLEDAFAFARSGYISIQAALNLTQYLENEKEIVVWETVLQHLEPIRHRLSSHTSDYKSFMTHIHKGVDNMLRSVGTEDLDSDAPFKQNFRHVLMSWACENGKPSRYCGEEARKTVGEWIINSANISTSSDKTVRSLSCAAAAEGGKEAFQLLYEKYQEVAEPDDLNGELKAAYNILKSIACTREPEIVQELLNGTLNPNSTANRDAHFIWEKLLENPIGRMEILPFLRSNLDRVLTMFDHRNDKEMRIGALNLISKVLMDLSTVSGFEEQFVEIEAFARDNESLLGKLTADFILAGISRQNVEWMRTEGKQVLEWLKYQN